MTKDKKDIHVADFNVELWHKCTGRFKMLGVTVRDGLEAVVRDWVEKQEKREEQ